jgi:hypothetical protein
MSNQEKIGINVAIDSLDIREIARESEGALEINKE